MNAETKILSQSDDALWSRVVHDVNAWRGACLQCFSAAEAGVTETLLSLSTVPEKGATVRLRHLTGQRFDDIAAVLGTEGAFAAEGKAAFKAIDAFRAHERLRTFLAHGVAKIAVERTDKWIVVYRQVSIRARQAERTMLLVEEAEGLEMLADIRRKSQQLCSILANLRHQLVK